MEYNLGLPEAAGPRGSPPALSFVLCEIDPQESSLKPVVPLAAMQHFHRRCPVAGPSRFFAASSSTEVPRLGHVLIGRNETAFLLGFSMLENIHRWTACETTSSRSRAEFHTHNLDVRLKRGFDPRATV
jgi:hypothetical protein